MHNKTFLIQIPSLDIVNHSDKHELVKNYDDAFNSKKVNVSVSDFGD